MRNFILLISFVFLLTANLFAAQGCLSGGQVYTKSPSSWYQWTNPVDDNCPSGASTSDVYAYVNNITNTSCSIGFLGWQGSGVLVDYTMMNCPIDDYIPFIIVIVGATGVFFVRKKHFLI